MKTLLIYPRFNYQATIQEPLGILYIASVLRKKREVSLIDLTFEKKLNFKSQILNSDLIAMSSTTAMFGKAIEVLNYIKNIDCDIPCIIGGSHSTIAPHDVLRFFDFAVIGEGERTILELVDALKKSKPLEKIDGIAYKKDDKIKINKPRKFIENLDAIPFPARDLIDYKKYVKYSSVGIIASRGCPFNCLFCKPMQNKLFGNITRKRSVGNVVDEIEQIKKMSNRIMFKDDTFGYCGLKWFEEFNLEMHRRNIEIEWECQSRVDFVNEKMLKIMKKSGCIGIAFGVESGSQKILNFYRKGITVEQIINAFDMCHKFGINTSAFIMLGAPMETKDDLNETVKLLYRINPNGIVISIVTPTVGTDLYEYAIKNRIYNVKNYNEADYYHTDMPMKLEFLNKKILMACIKIIKINQMKNMIKNSFTSSNGMRNLIQYGIKRLVKR